MSVSTVKITGTTVMTVSDTTATAANVSAGREFYAANGTKTQGTFVDEDADVLFVDYDGTELYGYSKTEFLALTELPPNPTHSGLTAQGWNWTLSDAKTYVTSYDKLCIGQNYITDDGKTRIYITIDTYPLIEIYWRQTVANGVIIDWGDGSNTETSSSTDQATLSHTYQNQGNYIITIEKVSGNLSLGGGSTSRTLFGNYQLNRHQSFQVKKIEIGNVNTLSSYAFYCCLGVEAISIPSSLNTSGSIWAAIWQWCHSLKCIVIPSGQDGKNMSGSFSYCQSLKYLTVPKSYTGVIYVYSNMMLKRIHFQEGITFITADACNTCPNLIYATIPNTVTEIRQYAFYNSNRLQNLKIPSSCLTLGTQALGSYQTIQEYTAPEGMTNLNSSFIGVRTLNSISLSSTITSLGSTKSFQNCRNLKFIEIPSGVTTLNEYDFNNCYSLQEAIIHGNITSIPAYCFSNCWSMIEFLVPSTVTSIATKAFENNYCLHNLIVLATIPPTLASDAISTSRIGVSDGKIYVPYGYGNTYKSASNWSDYASHIEELPEGWTP